MYPTTVSKKCVFAILSQADSTHPPKLVNFTIGKWWISYWNNQTAYPAQLYHHSFPLKRSMFWTQKTANKNRMGVVQHKWYPTKLLGVLYSLCLSFWGPPPTPTYVHFGGFPKIFNGWKQFRKIYFPNSQKNLIRDYIIILEYCLRVDNLLHPRKKSPQQKPPVCVFW